MEPETGYRFGRCTVDIRARQLQRDGEVGPLTAKVVDTLIVLVRNSDRIVGKDDVMSAVWTDSLVSEHSLTQNISAIRRALGDDSTQPRYVATIARKGCRFIAPIDRAGGAGEPGRTGEDISGAAARPA